MRNVAQLFRATGPFVLALVLDTCFGEPPPQLHPVVWMGTCSRQLHAPSERLPKCGLETRTLSCVQAFNSVLVSQPTECLDESLARAAALERKCSALCAGLAALDVRVVCRLPVFV